MNTTLISTTIDRLATIRLELAAAPAEDWRDLNFREMLSPFIRQAKNLNLLPWNVEARLERDYQVQRAEALVIKWERRQEDALC